MRGEKLQKYGDEIALARVFPVCQDARVPPETIQERLAVFGTPKGVIRDLRCVPTPDHIRYLDLMTAGDGPDAVIEIDSEPLAYVTSSSSPKAFATLRRSLMFRADAPYVLDIQPGKLEIHSLGLEACSSPIHHETKLTVYDNDEIAITTFERLFLGGTNLEGYQPHAIAERLTKLVNSSIEDIVAAGVEVDDAISFVGRAMFSRFLIDRNILTAHHSSEFLHEGASAEDFFSGPETSLRTCAWLDKTFNGDLLPLSFKDRPQAFAGLPLSVFECLQQIMRCEESPQQVFTWESINFSHIPAGLLSQVYERQASLWRSDQRKKDSIYYTPRRIAEFTVAEAFAQLREEQGDVSFARVLDPAVGGGIFLVTAFRELIGERWRVQRRQPDTVEIREILFHQLCGFDISESALRLTALSLYLAALELDPDPHPPARLKFDKSLRDRTLHQVSTGSPEVGSLRSIPEHYAAYDIILGNPPWTAVDKQTCAAIEVNLAKLVPGRTITLPDNVPDIPFLWAATRWARGDGMIALVMAARVLFKQSEVGIKSRNEISSQLEISGILNGSELRQTSVWEGITEPFCVVFAKNRCPRPNSSFFFVSPYRDTNLNQQGRLRIDAAAAQPVSPSKVIETPTLLKTLFRGTALDVGILEHVRSRCKGHTIANYWPPTRYGQGYKIAPADRQYPAEDLHEFRDLGSNAFKSTIIDSLSLPIFDRPTLHRPREIEIYRGPLVLLRKSPPAPGRAKRAAISFNDLVYSESIFGWSCKWHRSAKGLAKYLHLLFSSELFLWFLLMTSSEFGVERESIHVDDANRFFMLPYEDIKGFVPEINRVFQSVKTASSTQIQLEASINHLVNRIYKLDASQARTIHETLETRSSYKRVVNASQARPTSKQENEFISLIRTGLRPLAREGLKVTKCFMPGHAWQTLVVSTRNFPIDHLTLQYEAQADEIGASAVFEFRVDCLVISVLHQRRYWTTSRARLLVLELMNEHADKLGRILT